MSKHRMFSRVLVVSEIGSQHFKRWRHITFMMLQNFISAVYAENSQYTDHQCN